jgi:hypothetical protein
VEVEYFYQRLVAVDQAGTRLKELRSEAETVLRELAGAARERGLAQIAYGEPTVELLALDS